MTTPGSIPPVDPPPGGSIPPPSGAPLDYGTTTPGGPYVGPPPTKDDTTMAMLAHLLGIFGFIGPLIVWLIKKDQSPFVNDQGREALNFHLTMLIAHVAGAILTMACIGPLIILAAWIVGTIFSIIGAMKANTGVAYRYPFAIRFIK